MRLDPCGPNVNAITSGPQCTTKNISLAVKRRDVIISTLRESFALGFFPLKYFTRTNANDDIKISAIKARVK